MPGGSRGVRPRGGHRCFLTSVLSYLEAPWGGRAGGLSVPRARCGPAWRGRPTRPAGLCRKMSYDGNEEARTRCFSRSPVQSPARRSKITNAGAKSSFWSSGTPSRPAGVSVDPARLLPRAAGGAFRACVWPGAARWEAGDSRGSVSEQWGSSACSPSTCGPDSQSSAPLPHRRVSEWGMK